ncbi:MAG: hypothetical protein RLZ98_1947 [Pseudomonadota bacterium]
MQEPAGYGAREFAVRLIHDVIQRGILFDETLSRWGSDERFGKLEPRDRAFARLLSATALRRHGQIADVLRRFIEKPLPEARGRLTAILHAAAAHLLFLEGAPHAVINLAVEQCKRDRQAARFAKLANAVLRRAANEGPAIVAAQDAAALNVPRWLLERWSETYGAELAREIATASLREAALDLSVKTDPAAWAQKLGATLLATGSLRLAGAGQIEALAGYAEGAWWVQDAAAALPARLIGDVRGLEIADLCAAPGGKTAELVAARAVVTAVDSSAARLGRLASNLARLGLEAELVEADAARWDPGRLFDAVLLDAPCTATGTIRRHPDLLHLKSADDIPRLAELQAQLLERAARLVKPGGRLVYCTCSLEPEEGPAQVTAFLDRHPDFQRLVPAPSVHGLDPAWLTAAGELRTLPCHMPLAPPLDGGMDGFYAALLQRSA